jgi:hypothetical protein
MTIFLPKQIGAMFLSQHMLKKSLMQVVGKWRGGTDDNLGARLAISVLYLG